MTKASQHSSCKRTRRRPNLCAEDVSLPAACVSLSKLDANIEWMQAFADTNDVKLAPHGKTTMCPAIFARQLHAGAWAITLATAEQVAAAARHGITRVILANQLVGHRNMAIIADLLEMIEFYCIVDSIENIRQLERFFAGRKQALQVLIELGVDHGRTGCRTTEEVLELQEAITESVSLRLVGMEVYEGVIHGDDAAVSVSELLDRIIETTQCLVDDGAFEADEIVLTGAGSAWYDVVAERFRASKLPKNIVPVIRPGSYVIHDAGICNAYQDAILLRSDAANKYLGGLQNSLHVLAYVQSIPENGLAIIAMGKRDIAFSDGLPSPDWHYRPGQNERSAAPSHWEVFELMDQHTFMRIADNDDLNVGDIVAFSASHPCLTCDKWRQILAVDDDFNVLETWPTFF